MTTNGKRPKRGRPVGSGRGLTARLHLKLTPALLETCRAAAQRLGITESEWWRRAAMAYVEGPG
jgi:hypothetical protein